jgi:hypothetical protein
MMASRNSSKDLESRLHSQDRHTQMAAEAEVLDTIKWLNDGMFLRYQTTKFQAASHIRAKLEQVGHKFTEFGRQNIRPYSAPKLHELYRRVYDGYLNQYRSLSQDDKARLSAIYETVYGKKSKV